MACEILVAVILYSNVPIGEFNAIIRGSGRLVSNTDGVSTIERTSLLIDNRNSCKSRAYLNVSMLLKVKRDDHHGVLLDSDLTLIGFRSLGTTNSGVAIERFAASARIVDS